MEQEASLNNENPPAAKPLLGEVAFSSSQTTYKVMVNANGLNMRWYATKVKNEQVHFVSEIWCVNPALAKLLATIIDIFSCKDFDIQKAVDTTIDFFKPSSYELNVVKRGKDFPR